MFSPWSPKTVTKCATSACYLGTIRKKAFADVDNLKAHSSFKLPDWLIGYPSEAPTIDDRFKL